MPRVSIIVPIYNAQRYLSACVDSLLNQTLQDIEIILVDDGGQDNCPQLCDAYAKQDARIRVLHKPNGGVSAARNDGLQLATGEYVLFCDADDTMEPVACETLYDAGSAVGADVVIGDVYLVKNGKKKYAQFFASPFYTEDRAVMDALVRVDFSRKYCHDMPSGGPAFGYGGPWNKAVRRDFLMQSGIRFDESLHGLFDDILYTAYLYAEARRVIYITEPVYNYYLLAGSITHSYKPNIIAINEAIFSSFHRFLQKHGTDGRFDDAYDALIIRRLKGTLGVYFFHPHNPLPLHQQRRELKRLLQQEPYKSAVRRVNPSMLIHQYDLAVCVTARMHSALCLELVYRLYRLLKG